MAKQEKNIVTQGMSGKLGGIVFRQVAGKTVISQAPEKSKKEASEKQQKHKEKFQEATIYAKIAVVQEETKELYAKAAKKKKGLSAYNVAVADYLNAPDIKNIDLSEYTNEAGSKIKIIAVDDFMVKSVSVEIYSMDGSLMENGDAENVAGGLWVYTTVQNNPNLESAKIVVSASDLPGNITTSIIES
jgi:NADH dehydrogenase/NADH:ubiquinone oxidoreductase subunit G